MNDHGKTPVQFIRDISARQAALRRYARAFDRFSTMEQAFAGTAEGEGAHGYALIALRAYRSEIDDPQPRVEP